MRKKKTRQLHKTSSLLMITVEDHQQIK